jgi:hypothetical protein
MTDLINGKNLIKPEVEKAIAFAKENGIHADMHVGEEEEWFYTDTEKLVPEWLMGQYVDGFENHDFIGYFKCVEASMQFLNTEVGKAKNEGGVIINRTEEIQ